MLYVQKSTDQGKKRPLGELMPPLLILTQKCDVTAPICQKCAKSGRICIETRAAKQSSFEIHIENAYVSTNTRRPRGPRSQFTTLRPRVDMQSRALLYFLERHVKPVESISAEIPMLSGHLADCISAWRDSGNSNDMVDLGLTALALAIFSRTQHCTSAAIEANARYSRLLKLVHRQISEIRICPSDQKSVDASLLTALIMNRYEHSIHSTTYYNSINPMDLQTIWSHFDGATAILKAWRDSPNQSPPSRIIKGTRRSILWASVLRGREVPDWLFCGSLFGEDECVEVLFDHVVVRLAYMRHTLVKLKSLSGYSVEEMEKWHICAQEMDTALNIGQSRLPVGWICERHVLPSSGSFPNSSFYSPIVYSYKNLGHAALWSQFSATKMLISCTRLKILDLLRPHQPDNTAYKQQRSDCVAELRSMADFLASSIPFCYERFAVRNSNYPSEASYVNNRDLEERKPHLSALLLWPLAVAAKVEGIDILQQEWFRSQLVKVGRMMGNGVIESTDNCPIMAMILQ
jgi:hypothetical protein